MMSRVAELARGAIRGEFFEQLRKKAQRDRDLPIGLRLQKSVRFVEGLVLSPIYLRECSVVGRRARTRGVPFIENHGRIEIGDDFNFASLFVQSHLVTGPAGLLRIGDSVNINFGAAISAHESVTIGSRVRIGPYAMIMDSDYHATTNREERPSAPIVIGDDVWLAGRVSVLKGSRIGQGSVITAGSVVSGEIPPGVIAGGVPARVFRQVGSMQGQPRDGGVQAASDGQASASVVERVQKVATEIFGLQTAPDISWGPREIPKWDSLGQLNLTMSLEHEFGVSFRPEQIMRMHDIRSVCSQVQASLQGH